MCGRAVGLTVLGRIEVSGDGPAPGRMQDDVTVARPGGLEGLDDAALVEASRKGRREGFDVLVKRHQRPIYHLCYRFAGNHEDASDLVQETFLRAYRSVARFRGESAFGTWLHRIAVNVCLNRAAMKRPPVDPIPAEWEFPDRAPDPAAALMAKERAARVRAAIAKLPPRQRATLILRVYGELQHQEIARVLNSSVGTVKANFFHALANLRRLLSGEP
jgi:RNA polymerase sigma-70 factor, ECF subfamily